MSTTTTNYGLIKPDTTDPILIGQLNDNADAIDAALKENADAIENKPDAADIPTPSTTAPAMNGTAAAGTSTDYARADHVHPSDTSRASAASEAEDRAALIELVDGSSKNMLDLSKATSVSVGAGITYTLAADGTLTVNWEGLTTGKTLKFKSLPYIGGTLILSGVQSLTSPTVFRADVRQGETPDTRTDIRTMDYGESPKEAFTMLNDVYDYVIRIDVPSGESSTSGTATLQPMICTKAAWDISQTYQSYRPSYQELYDMVKALQPAI